MSKLVKELRAMARHEHDDLARPYHERSNSMIHAEDSEALALWQWAQLQPFVRDHLYHIPNGGTRNAREAARMKNMGVRAGVSDYHLPLCRRGYHGLWIELKAPKGKPTATQIEWIERMEAAGHYAEICHGWEKAAQLIKWYCSE